jgi:hypothetical protein
MHENFHPGSLTGRQHLEKLGKDWRIILKLISQEKI